MVRVEFRLLGSFEVRADHGSLQVGGAAERALLALLLLSPRRTVAATSLMERLWSEDGLPADPVNALHLRVSKLRRALRTAGIDVVVRDGAGYRADVDPDAIDAEVFVRCIRAGRAAAGEVSADTARALAFYDEALAKWRGDPLAEFSTQPWATVEAARLSQMYQAAVTERAQLALGLGRHREVVGDLEALVAQDPKQETLAGLLMTALYRGGRQADALEVFTRTRVVLDEELGLEPSAALKSLRQRILRQDADLAGPRDVPDLDIGPLATTRDALTHMEVQDGGQTAMRSRIPSDFAAAWRRLIGREEDLRSLDELVRRSRMVTLVGPGGAGKTVLAVALSNQVKERFQDGATLIRLAPVVDEPQVAFAVADALGVPLDGAAAGTQARTRVMSYLQGREVLLVLDNCEHVIDAAARLTDEILNRCPGVSIIATSREALAIPGEVQVAVLPLPVPPEGTRPEDVLGYSAAQLFVERARSGRGGLTLDDDTLTAIARITAALDGMPLALELAAARISSLSPAELADRLADRFRLLTGGPRTAEARQRTLRATVDWSHALLSEVEQIVFRRLAAFHGGWTLAAAEAVAGDSDANGDTEVSRSDVLDVLGRLVDRSMVLAEPGRPTRYRMLETLRQYAAERLAEAGELDLAARRHAEYFRDLATVAEGKLRGGGQRHTLQALREEQPNLRSALGWLSAHPDQIEDALLLAGALGWFWHLGRHLEGREILRRLTASGNGSGLARAKALLAVSLVERPRACLVHPSPVCAAAARASIELFVAGGDLHRAALAKVLLAVEGVGRPDSAESARLLAEAEGQFTAEDDAWGHAVIAFVRMETHLKSGDEARATATGRAAAAAFRELDDPWGLSAVLYHLGWGLRQFGRYADAIPILEDAIEVAAAAGLHNTVQWALGDLGIALIHIGDLDGAALTFQRAAAASDAIGDGAGKVLEAYGRGLLAQVATRWEQARELFIEAHRGFIALGTPVPAAYALAGRARCDEDAGALQDAAEAYREVLDIGTTVAEPGLRAFALEGLGRLAMLADPVAGAELLEQARTVRQEGARPVWPHERAERSAVPAPS